MHIHLSIISIIGLLLVNRYLQSIDILFDSFLLLQLNLSSLCTVFDWNYPQSGINRDLDAIRLVQLPSDLIFPGGVDVVVDGLLLPRQTKEGAHGRRGRCDQLQACHGSVQVRLRGGAVAPADHSNSSLGLCSQVHWVGRGRSRVNFELGMYQYQYTDTSIRHFLPILGYSICTS